MVFAPRLDATLRWDHLLRLTGALGLFEHARYDTPRIALGYTTDDNARALVVLARARPDVDAAPYLRHLLDAFDGRHFRNRRRLDGRWTSEISDDATGRAVWGLGEWIGAGRGDRRVRRAFRRGLRLRTPHPRSVAYMLLGVAAASRTARIRWDHTLLHRLPRPRPGQWVWPAPRLTYANARLPEALIRAGALAGDDEAVKDGLVLLEWLMETEQGEGGLSFTPVGGRGPGDPKPAFDQQPIEAWAMVDAAYAAWEIDGSQYWREAMVAASHWFLGRNDAGLILYDPETGAGYDGLGPDYVNLNQGAESTLAALGSLWRLQGGNAR